jgi:hypothetical protein
MITAIIIWARFVFNLILINIKNYFNGFKLLHLPVIDKIKV